MLNAVFFSTSTCGHCRPFKKILEEVAQDYDDLDVTYRVVDKEPESYALFKEWQLTGVPTLIFVKDGVAQVADMIVGAVPRKDLESIINRYLEKNDVQENTCGVREPTL